MNITEDKLRVAWQADRNGNEIEADFDNLNGPARIGYRWLHMRFPGQVVEEICALEPRDDGGLPTAREVATFRDTYPDDTATALVRSGEWSHHQAALICSIACSRCLNALAHRYVGPEQGFPEFSKEWHDRHTQCVFCEEHGR